MTVEEFIGKEVYYEDAGFMIFGKQEDGTNQLLLDVRGWGTIQYFFKDEQGNLDLNKAAKFQDKIGEWIVDAINQKIQKAEGGEK